MLGRILATVSIALLSAAMAGCGGSSDGGVTGPHTIEVGPVGADYTSIQQAINAAEAGSIILVQSGTYTERIDIIKSLTIIGSGAGTVVEYPAGGMVDSAVIEILNTSGVTIEGLSVRSTIPDVDGIRVRDASAVVLDSVVASNNTQDGIDVRRSSGVDITSGTFENNGGDGVQVDETSTSVAIVSCRTASNGADGIKVRSSSFVLVQDNTSVLNSDDGILVRDSTAVQVIGNTATSNAGWGITINDSPDTILDGNTVNGNGDGDIKCEPAPCLPPP
jgi:parallel beta-helix repeat protein